MKVKFFLFYSLFIQNFACAVSVYLPSNATPTELLLRTKKSSKKINNTTDISLIRSILAFVYEFKNLYSTNSHEGLFSVKECTYDNLIERIHYINQRQEKVSVPPGTTTCQAIQRMFRTNSLYGFIPTNIKEGVLSTQPQYFNGMKNFHTIIDSLQVERNLILNKYWDEIKSTEKVLKSPQELLILASLIEKETFHNPEKPTISGVYKNRLAKNMRLQCCPTVIYILTKGCEEFKRKLNYTDLKTESPYNTYRKIGLPPTPICNPSEESIKSAALHETHEYLYFVASTKGQHRFSSNYNEHKENKTKWKKELDEFKKRKEQAS